MERLCMRKVREVLRLTEMGRSQREVAAVLRISVGTVVGYLKRSRVAALTWERAAEMTDEAVEAELFRDVGRNLPTTRAPIPFARVHQDLSRVGVTLELLWEEYQAAALAAGGSVPYRYSQFCELYGAWRRRLSPTMRQVHRAGEKAFIDYSGKKPCIYDRHTGAAEPVELFVMVLGASNYTYAEATRTQRLADFTASVARGLEYFGAAPEVLVPDQLRSAVRGSDWYDPLINEVFQDLAQHYGLAVLPARPRKARDKAKVENAVLVAQRWVVARLRNRKFFSLSELNEAITELLEELNARPFKKLEGCRQSAFLELDRPAMHPLPVVRFELRERHKARVNIDYHVEFDYRLYSIPYTLIGEQIEVRATATVVEIFHAGERAASHARSYGRRGTSVTCHEHRPPQHQQLKWPPERLVSWAAKFGPAVATVVERTLAQYVHPKHGYRACLGILRVAEKHGAERMQSACSRALAASSSRAPHRKYIEAILRQGLDRQPTPPPVSRTLPLQHENVRGGEYYDRKETIH
ncbi:MAG: IS21 family transposase [Polyangiaceae bacterium]|nr:IS21 family transposase [Polyangiaceae bacterium]